MLQLWSVSNALPSAKDQPYRLRRAQFKFLGNLGESAEYFLMVDPAKLIAAPNSLAPAQSEMIRDFGVSRRLTSRLEVTAGQFTNPTTAEGLDSSSELLFPERSVVARALGNAQEMGAQVSYRAPRWNVTTMASSGRMLGAPGASAVNDLHIRAESTPLANASIGSFVTLENLSYSSRGRWGANARYRLDRLDLRVEFAQGRDYGVQERGFTADLAYALTRRAGSGRGQRAPQYERRQRHANLYGKHAERSESRLTARAEKDKLDGWLPRGSVACGP